MSAQDKSPAEVFCLNTNVKPGITLPNVPLRYTVWDGNVYAAQLQRTEGKAFLTFAKDNLSQSEIGLLGTAHIVEWLPEGKATVEFRGKLRGYAPESLDETCAAWVKPVESTYQITPEFTALVKEVAETFKKFYAKTKQPEPSVNSYIDTLVTDGLNFPDSLAAYIINGKIPDLQLSEGQQRRFLMTLDPMERLKGLHEILLHEGAEQEVRQSFGEQHKQHILRKKMEVIQQELGEGNQAEIDELAKKVQDAGMSEEAAKKCQKELNKLRRMHPTDPNYNRTFEYLEHMIDIPWRASSEIMKDLSQAEAVLDEDHYGLETVKERIVEHLAVQRHTGKTNGTILTLVGPPGVGKTSLGQSIAKATGRKFVRAALGGVHDEAAIRGHRSTYIGSMPGKIIEAMKDAGTVNPVIQLDEIDKMGQGNKISGDPTSALLEVLDPAQNHAFVDHYTGVKHDLSQVMFVCSANYLNMIPEALRDRMEIIFIDGYTDEEKTEIAKRYLTRKARETNGVDASQFSIDDQALAKIIDKYTREAGVRNLEREINKLARKAVRQIQRHNAKGLEITPENLEIYAGPPKFTHVMAEETPRVGRVNGLYVSGNGGGILPFEAVMFEDSKGGTAMATGSLQDVMKESVSDAFDYVRANARGLGIPAEVYQKHTLHIKAGDGATPKDGPSAGLAIATLIVSVLTGIPIRSDVAMTGEVGLSGKSMPIGGVKQKLLGAYRAGIKRVLIPAANAKDLAEVPAKLKQQMEIIQVENMKDVLKYALVETPKPLAAKPKDDNLLEEGSVKKLLSMFAEAVARASSPPANDEPSFSAPSRAVIDRPNARKAKSCKRSVP